MYIRLRLGGHTEYCQGWVVLAHTVANIYLRQTQKNLKRATLVGGKVKIHGVENAFLSQSDDQQGSSVQDIINYTFSPRAVY